MFSSASYAVVAFMRFAGTSIIYLGSSAIRSHTPQKKGQPHQEDSASTTSLESGDSKSSVSRSQLDLLAAPVTTRLVRVHRCPGSSVTRDNADRTLTVCRFISPRKCFDTFVFNVQEAKVEQAYNIFGLIPNLKLD